MNIFVVKYLSNTFKSGRWYWQTIFLVRHLISFPLIVDCRCRGPLAGVMPPAVLLAESEGHCGNKVPASYQHWYWCFTFVFFYFILQRKMLRHISPNPDRLQTENLALSIKQWSGGGEPQPPAPLSELSVWELSDFNLLRYIENSTPFHSSKRLQTEH